MFSRLKAYFQNSKFIPQHRDTKNNDTQHTVMLSLQKVEPLTALSPNGLLPALPLDLDNCVISLTLPNTLAYYYTEKSAAIKGFMIQALALGSL